MLPKGLYPIVFVLLLSLPAQGRGATPDKKTAIPAHPQAPATWQEPNSGIKFIKIPAGCFMMGQSKEETRQLKRGTLPADYEKYYADELPQHKVCLDEFWMETDEVSQREWQKVMGFNPSVFQEDPNFPVDMVSWKDAQGFADKLNELNNSSEFRLPTEAEWEYAARAGTTTMYSTGDTISSAQANYNGTYPFAMNLRDEYRKGPTPVGTFPPNQFGLHDMHGNVWEWCSDWYQPDYYEKSPPSNPTGPDAGQTKVLRGGSWFRYSAHIRSATRYKNKETGQYADTGFRLVKSPKRLISDSSKPLLFDKDF